MDWVWNVIEPLRVDALRSVLGVDGSVGNFSLLFFPPLLSRDVRRRSLLSEGCGFGTLRSVLLVGEVGENAGDIGVFGPVVMNGLLKLFILLTLLLLLLLDKDILRRPLENVVLMLDGDSGGSSILNERRERLDTEKPLSKNS
jgi:hypothetical protein